MGFYISLVLKKIWLGSWAFCVDYIICHSVYLGIYVRSLNDHPRRTIHGFSISSVNAVRTVACGVSVHRAEGGYLFVGSAGRDGKEGQMKTTEENAHETFLDYATERGINMEDEEDWGPWWECFITGYNAAVKFIRKEIQS